MQQNENDVIRYLMKEMDPSEEVLMERAMMEDDDLLIEVESMRQTLGRLDDMPEKSPPVDLTNRIVEQAQQQASSTWSVPVNGQWLKYAAVLLVGIGLGSVAWFATTEITERPSSSQQMAAEVSLPATIEAINNLTPSASTANAASPWVDNDDVIYYQDQFNFQAGDYSAGLREASQSKLKLINQPNLGARGAESIQLTSGSSRQN